MTHLQALQAVLMDAGDRFNAMFTHDPAEVREGYVRAVALMDLLAEQGFYDAAPAERFDTTLDRAAYARALAQADAAFPATEAVRAALEQHGYPLRDTAEVRPADNGPRNSPAQARLQGADQTAKLTVSLVAEANDGRNATAPVGPKNDHETERGTARLGEYSTSEATVERSVADRSLAQLVRTGFESIDAAFEAAALVLTQKQQARHRTDGPRYRMDDGSIGQTVARENAVLVYRRPGGEQAHVSYPIEGDGQLEVALRRGVDPKTGVPLDDAARDRLQARRFTSINIDAMREKLEREGFEVVGVLHAHPVTDGADAAWSDSERMPSSDDWRAARRGGTTEAVAYFDPRRGQTSLVTLRPGATEADDALDSRWLDAPSVSAVSMDGSSSPAPASLPLSQQFRRERDAKHAAAPAPNPPRTVSDIQLNPRSASSADFDALGRQPDESEEGALRGRAELPAWMPRRPQFTAQEVAARTEHMAEVVREAQRAVERGDSHPERRIVLQNMDLRGVDVGAVLAQTAPALPLRLSNCDLTGANLAGLRLGAALSAGARARHVLLDGCTIAHACLARTHVDQEVFAQAPSSLAGIDLTAVDLRGIDLSGRDLRGATLRAANLTRARLDSADLRGADFAQTQLNRAHLIGANLEACDLTQAELSSTDLRGAFVDDATRVAPVVPGVAAPRVDGLRGDAAGFIDQMWVSDAARPPTAQLIRLSEAQQAQGVLPLFDTDEILAASDATRLANPYLQSSVCEAWKHYLLERFPTGYTQQRRLVEQLFDSGDRPAVDEFDTVAGTTRSWNELLDLLRNGDDREWLGQRHPELVPYAAFDDVRPLRDLLIFVPKAMRLSEWTERQLFAWVNHNEDIDAYLGLGMLDSVPHDRVLELNRAERAALANQLRYGSRWLWDPDESRVVVEYDQQGRLRPPLPSEFPYVPRREGAFSTWERLHGADFPRPDAASE